MSGFCHGQDPEEGQEDCHLGEAWYPPKAAAFRSPFARQKIQIERDQGHHPKHIIPQMERKWHEHSQARPQAKYENSLHALGATTSPEEHRQEEEIKRNILGEV